MNDVKVGTAQDNTPITSGTGFSFRTRECVYNVNNLKVYRSRVSNGSTSVSIGSATSDVRFQSPDPSAVSYSCKIKSLTYDSLYNVSAVNNQDLLIDWSAPLVPAQIRDGLSTDVATSVNTNSLSANWDLSSDQHSSVVVYWYCIGSTAGASDVQAWTNANLNTNVTTTGLSLNVGSTYYVSVKVENGAGLFQLFHQRFLQQLVSHQETYKFVLEQQLIW
jgi:hypothetical protein